MAILGLILRKGDTERLGADPEGIDPLEAAFVVDPVEGVVVVVFAALIGPLESLADLLRDLSQHLDIVLLPLAKMFGYHEHVAQAEDEPHDCERPKLRGW